VSWPTPEIPALRSWRQEDEKFKANLGYIPKSYLTIITTTIIMEGESF
jgi:hypothetical protein